MAQKQTADRPYHDWEKVNVRGPLLAELDALVEQNPMFGNRSEAIHAALREFIERRRATRQIPTDQSHIRPLED